MVDSNEIFFGMSPMKRLRLSLLFILLTPLLAYTHEEISKDFHDEKVIPVANRLKVRQPNWRPEVVSYFPDGGAQEVLFYEPQAEKEERAVKRIIFLTNGNIQLEEDLTLIDENDPLAKELETTIVPHGLSVSYYSSGIIENLLHYKNGHLHGGIKKFFPNGKLRVYMLAKDGLRHGKAESVYDNGQKQEEGTYQEGQLVGAYTFYSRDGKRTAFYNYVDGVLEGEALEWFSNGSLKSVKHYQKGLLHGDGAALAITIYGEDQGVQEIQDLRNGIPLGLHCKYHPNGKEAYKVKYVKGLKEGKEELFSEDGELLGFGTFKNGTPIGLHELKNTQHIVIKRAKYDDEGNLLEPITEFYEDGTLKRKYSLIGDDYHGEYQEWYTNDQLKNHYSYFNGHFNELQREYYESGALKLNAFFDKGLQDGLFEEFYEDGQLKLQATFNKGNKEASLKEWYPLGVMKREEFYEEGLLTNTKTEWFESGILRSVEGFLLGKRDGLSKIYSEEKQLIRQVVFKEDLPHGEFFSWYSNGKLQQKMCFIEGKKEGKEESFYSNGQIKSSIFYHENQMAGDLLTWFEDGTPQVIACYEEGKPVGKHIEYYPLLGNDTEKKIKRFANFRDGKLYDEQKSFFENGQTEILLTYDDGVLNGQKSLWQEDGTLLEEAFYKKGKLEGRFFQIAKDGSELIFHYKDNLKEGPHIVYYPNHDVFGRIKALEANFSDDLLDGEIKEYNEAGVKVASTFYKDGKKEGITSIYTPEGNLLVSEKYNNDHLNGEWFQYFPNGKTYKELFYQDGLKEGEEKVYYGNGRIATINIYLHDQLNGCCVHYNPEGTLTFEGEYKEGSRHGKFNKYFDDGTPELIQTYCNDKLHGLKERYDQEGHITRLKYDMGVKINS